MTVTRYTVRNKVTKETVTPYGMLLTSPQQAQVWLNKLENKLNCECEIVERLIEKNYYSNGYTNWKNGQICR